MDPGERQDFFFLELQHCTVWGTLCNKKRKEEKEKEEKEKKRKISLLLGTFDSFERTHERVMPALEGAE